MRVFVTGLTGFVGSFVGRALLEAGHEVVALVRLGSEPKLGDLEHRVTIVHGDVNQVRSLEAGMAGCDAVINLVGIIKEVPGKGVTFEKLHWEATRHLVDAAKAQGIGRFLQMSANGVKPEGTGYQVTKHRAEEYLKASGLAWTIFRPSVVFGEPDGRMNFVTELAAPMRFAPAFPIFGDGDFPMQPVAATDVALAFARALTSPAAVGKTYCLGGARTLTYKEVARTIARALGREHLALVSVPLPFVQVGVSLGEHVPHFPITRDQLAMLVEGNACADTAWVEDLGITPQAFTVEALRFLKEPAAV
ncbi:MAG: complex I NDUFA9 subunit family protein [Candidatus Sericytochromatia bacterium]